MSPFPDGSIIEIETTVGLVYLVTVPSIPRPHRVEGRTLAAPTLNPKP